MKIVSDTGPIIGLAKIGKIILLNEIADEVIIPQMVYKELFGKTGPESNEIDQALNTFIIVKKDIALDEAAKIELAGLDEGEKQAIGLASQLDSDVILLLDDRAGRRVAARMNISTTGLIGLLLVAKERGVIQSVGILIKELRENGYWLSDEIMKIAIKLAGE